MEREGCQARLCLLEESFDLDHEATRAVQLRLLRYGLRVSNKAAVPLLREQAEPLPRLFSRSALLRDTLPLWLKGCLLYTSDAADDLLCVDLGGRRIIKKKNH